VYFQKLLSDTLEVSFCDVAVINSCTVTGTGDKKTKQLIRKLKRDNQNIIIALTGCFPQAFPQEAENFTYADVITGSYNRTSLCTNVLKFIETKQRIVDITPHKQGESFEKMKVSNFSEKTRAFVKIQDGCDRFCSYCIIPYARGFLRSKTIEDIKSEILSLVENGYKEIVLVGINLSKYGIDINYCLNDAVKAVCEFKDIIRVRLGSLEPDLLDENTIENLSKNHKLCPQFHLSLQSGCDETLKRMNRHYNTHDYEYIVSLFRKYFKNPSITTDVMTGFAGETEEEFNKSLTFVKKINFSKVHVFSYSIRQGTLAAKMPNQIDNNIKKLRSEQMIFSTEKIRENILNKKIGQVVTILCETFKNGIISGYTKDYTPCFFKHNESLKNNLVEVKIVEIKNLTCYCQLINVL
ncbi:MAG: tRNA (N(6)-L-threonylcarbamoyladenosine(37)-C(2))-methylthiotransferase MtaB, partial [Oscillospiraceae bacterium]